ncbi:MAG: peroxisomal N(1)-acetyl-spermine/spermidine oxidase [Trebouxia sp. A1-2]|nr:MAG: peroxisomal N(1)-acetyl-spermine/spermidine oxidase [Trebouxia sp. A1-2]
MSFANRTAGWRRLVSENLGIRGSKNLAAWAVAGTAAYILWIKPEQKEQQKRIGRQDRIPI